MRKLTITSIGVFAAAGIGLGSCSSGGGPSASASAHAAPATSSPRSSPAVDYRAQDRADIAPVNRAKKRITSSDTISSPAVVVWGTAASVTARKLLRQSWPAGDRADVRKLAVAAETTAADISQGNTSRLVQDAPVVQADAQVVRADLGLPS